MSKKISKQEKLVREVQEEVRTYAVPVFFTKSGHITVEASSPEEAVKKAEAAWDGQDCIEDPTVDVDFADPEDVEAEDEDWDEDEDEDE